MNLIIPKNYNPVLDLRDTEIAIKLVKDFFETELARALNLTRVSAPAAGAENLRLLRRRRPVYRYERHPAG